MSIDLSYVQKCFFDNKSNIYDVAALFLLNQRAFWGLKETDYYNHIYYDYIFSYGENYNPNLEMNELCLYIKNEKIGLLFTIGDEYFFYEKKIDDKLTIKKTIDIQLGIFLDKTIGKMEIKYYNSCLISKKIIYNSVFCKRNDNLQISLYNSSCNNLSTIYKQYDIIYKHKQNKILIKLNYYYKYNICDIKYIMIFNYHNYIF